MDLNFVKSDLLTAYLESNNDKQGLLISKEIVSQVLDDYRQPFEDLKAALTKKGYTDAVKKIDEVYYETLLPKYGKYLKEHGEWSHKETDYFADVALCISDTNGVKEKNGVTYSNHKQYQKSYRPKSDLNCAIGFIEIKKGE